MSSPDNNIENESIRKTDSVSVNPDQQDDSYDLFVECLTRKWVLENYFKYDRFTNKYIFILSISGSATLKIDLADIDLCPPHGLIIAPNKIFRCLSISEDAKALGIAINRDKFPKAMIERLDSLYLDSSPFIVTEERREELLKIFDILDNRANGDTIVSGHHKTSLLLARSFAAIMVESLHSRTIKEHSDKLTALPLLSRLASLFENNLHISRLPSHYASLLGITPTYLNDKLRPVLGINISRYIQQESVLQACRLLVLTDLSIQMIADKLGYDSSPYFTRQFTKIIGMSPSAFRKSLHH